MVFDFDLQRFPVEISSDKIIIPVGESCTFDGVTYTAVTSTQLNRTDEKVSGISSGKVTAVATNKTAPAITFDATAGAFDFSADVQNGALAVTLTSIGSRTLKFTEGTATITKTGITTGAAKFSVNGIYSAADYTFDIQDAATFSLTSGVFSVSSEEFSVAVTKGQLALNFDVSGTATRDFTNHTFSFTKDTTIATTLAGYTFTATAQDASGAGFNFDSNGITFTPNSSTGAVSLSVTRNGTAVFSNELSISGGSVFINPLNNNVGITKGTKISLAFDGYTFTVTAAENIQKLIVFTQDEISFSPNGKLNLTLSNGTDSLNAMLEVLSGSLTLGENGALTVSKDTELQLNFGNGYVVDLKATGDAGGKISLSDDGINFTPNSSDGKLELSVTENGQTRTATLEMTGSVTYALDGSISLAKGTVLKNIFADGNKLTITAKDDVDGSITFDPADGLTITSSTPDALEVTLTFANSNMLGFTSIDGTINYKGGTVTAFDGTTVYVKDEDFGDYSTHLSVTGGTASVRYTPSKDIYTVSDGATLAWEYSEGTTFELRKGTFTDVFNAETPYLSEILSEGADFSCNNEEVIFMLENAGTYTLNGIQVTTTVDNVDVQLAGDDAVIVNGITYTALDENLKITLGENTANVTGGKFTTKLEGSDETFTFDTTDGEMHFTSETVGGVLKVTVANSEFDLVSGTRTASLDVTGSMIYGADGSLSLANGTKVNLAWDDGTKLELNSTGSTGSIAFDAEKGFKITSDDENLNMKLTTVAGFTTELSGLKGSLWYDAGVVSFEENSKLTATSTIGGQPILTTLETLNGTGHLSFNTTNGVLYAADTGALRVTWSKETLESTFIVNSGSVQLGHNLFRITEGSDIATDLKSFVPAFYFTTSEAGTYTINGQKITTSAANLALTATDDQMVFTTGSNVVEYDGMTFAGNGKVSLKSDSVVLGAGVEAAGFGEGNSFVLAEAGNVTADAKIFELSELYLNRDGENVLIPMIITVTGAKDGFIFSRTLTEESEEYLDEKNSPYVGQVFTEKFISAGDSSYRIRTDPIGLEEVIGISNGATVTGGASLANEPTLSYYNLITDTEGKFTIGERSYTVSGDSNVVIRARFAANTEPYASYFSSLSGTVSGDFTGHPISINGSGIQVFGDKDVSIAADASGLEILGLDKDASVSVSAAGTYSVNGLNFNAKGGDVIVGNSDGSAHLYSGNYFDNNSSNTIITGTSGDDYITNMNASHVTINAGNGNNTIESNLHYEIATIDGQESLISPYSDLSIVSGAGNDTIYNSGGSNIVINTGAGDDFIYNIHGYYATINGGAGDDFVLISRGHYQYLNGGAGNDTLFGSLTGGEGWAIGGHATVDGGDGDDLIDVAYSNDSSLLGGAGNDSIIVVGPNNSVDGGTGSNRVTLFGASAVVALSGNTTVEGFHTGFGKGTDTIYINGDPAGVDFKNGVLTFFNSTDSLTLSDVTTTAQVNIYHEMRQVLNKGVFIAYNDWYSVTNDDLSLSSGEEVYFVGTTDKPNHGVDFSGISSALNVTIDTAYIDSEDYVPGTSMWVNNVYSIRGSAGLTTITGSDKNDTIFAGSGSTTINASGGNDYISLQSSAALVQYKAGDGNDTIAGFNANSTLSISGSAYNTAKSGNDLIVTVGESKITLLNAANLSLPNIESDYGGVAKIFVDAALKRTAAGYPQIAAVAFHPDEDLGDEPTNYSAKEDWTITSSDNLKLHAIHYTPENSGDKWVVLVHGYGKTHKELYAFAEAYLANNFNVLLIDQRAAGESEGTWLTMGAAESEDVAHWTREIANRNSNAKITLHGVSMGSATAMLAAARSDTKNVTALVEDCGYTNVMDVFRTINAAYLGQPDAVIDAMDPVAKAFTGYYLHDAAPIDSISAAKMPTLFISGDADVVVPVSMLNALYDASGAEVKETYFVEGAEHGMAAFDDPDNYGNAVFRFIAEANHEGWNTANTVSAISLRGTKYSDTISNSGANVTINAGLGDDYINLQNSKAVIEYTTDDGNDLINGFSANSTLSISGEKYYYSITDGNDVIVHVGDGEITLSGAASLSSPKIVGGKQIPFSAAQVLDTLANFDITDKAQLVDGDQLIDLRKETDREIISIGSGVQTLYMDGAERNILEIGDDATGGKKVHFGNGGTFGVITGKQANNFVTLGSGLDTVAITNNATARIEMGTGAAKIIPYSGKVTLDNYNVTTGAAIQTLVEDVAGAIKDNTIAFDGYNEIQFETATVKINSPFVNLISSGGSTQKVGFSGGGSLNASTDTNPVVLKGNYAENSADEQINIGSTLIAGRGNDTILAGAKDYVVGGAGDNKIFLTPYNLREGKPGAKIGLDGGGNTAVQNFHAGFETNSDAFYTDGGIATRLRFDGENLTASVRGGAQVTLDSIADDAEFAEILTFTGDTRTKVAVAKPGGTITSTAAQVYLGRENAAVDFSGTNDTLLVNLGDDAAVSGSDQKQFYGITKATAGDGLSTLIGNAERNTLTAGNGHTTLRGGAGNDLLVGKADSDAKNGRTTFLFLAGDDHDTIENFNFTTAENEFSGLDDRIEITEANEVTGAFVNGNDVVLQINDADDYLRIKNAAGKNFQINNLLAKVDKNISYDGFADCYVANDGSSLTVAETVDDAEIWLDGSHGKYFLGEIHTLDATNAAGSTSLVGNEFDNTIRAGHGDASLWGGSSTTDDLLIGGGSRNTFFYCNGNGRDTVQGVNDDDEILLADVSLDQIIGTEIAANAVSINFIDGGSLTVLSNKNVTYQLADGSKYSANHEQAVWTSK